MQGAEGVAVLQLVALDVGNNSLTGAVPDTWEALTQASKPQHPLLHGAWIF